jgi:formate dehydrogenase subunit gamma
MQKNGDWDNTRADAIIAAHKALDGAALPILHALQKEFGYIDDAAIDPIARALNVSRAEIHGVVTFYHDFRAAKPGRHVLRLCRAEACQSRGADALVEHAAMRAKGQAEEITLEPVFCLGLCATAPAAMLDGELHGRLTQTRLDALIDGCAR